MGKITVEIAYALPERFFLKKISVEQGTTVEAAIIQSAVLQKFKNIDLANNKVGIFSRAVKLGDILQHGDRIEIYRPLTADPQEIRRKRAEQQQQNKHKK